MDLIFLKSQVQFVLFEMLSCILIQMKIFPAKLAMNIKELCSQYCPKDIFLYVFSCVFTVSRMFTKGKDDFSPLCLIFGFVGSNSSNASLIPWSEWGQTLSKWRKDFKISSLCFLPKFIIFYHVVLVTPLLFFSIFPFYPRLVTDFWWPMKGTSPQLVSENQNKSINLVSGKAGECREHF